MITESIFIMLVCDVMWCACARGVVWCGVVWCGVVWCGVVWCGVVCHCNVDLQVPVPQSGKGGGVRMPGMGGMMMNMAQLCAQKVRLWRSARDVLY